MSETTTKTKKTPHQKNKSALKRLLITFAVFSFLLIFMIILRQFTAAALFLNNTLSRAFIFVMGGFINIFPFSVFEIFVYAATLFVLTYLILTIVFLAKKRRLKALHSFLAILLAVLVCITTFFMAAGFSYAQIVSPVRTYDGDITLVDLERITAHFLDDFNDIAKRLERDAHGNVISPYTDRELSDLLNAEFDRADLPGVFSGNRRIKTFQSGRLMSELGVGGVFFPPLAEGNINALLPASSRPFVMAHELAHAKGVMREDFANEAAWYITLNSDNDFIRYSGYMSAFNGLINGFVQFGHPGMALDFRNRRHPYIIRELHNNTMHWGDFMTMENLSNWINGLYDWFLRIMGQEDGTGAYTPNFDFETDYVRNPETGEVIINPETNRPDITFTPIFNNLQKVFFHIYM